MEEVWHDSPDVFLEAVQEIEKKFPHTNPADILESALTTGVGLSPNSAAVFGRVFQNCIVRVREGSEKSDMPATEALRAAVQEMQTCVVVDTTYDLDWLAGYAAEDPKKIYIDRGFQRMRVLSSGRSVDLEPYLVLHEVVEKCLLDRVQFPARGYHYAHQIAQWLERSAVEADAISWDEYQGRIMTQEIKRVSDMTPLNVPPDLDLAPYRDTQDPNLETIVARMRASRLFRVSKIGEQIYHLLFADAKQMATTLMRFEEFYESPQFKGIYFTHEAFDAWYGAQHSGKMYADDWAEGFNFPSSAFEPFYEGHFAPLTSDEELLLGYFKDLRNTPFYVIATAGTTAQAIFAHEIAHALYFTNNEYKKEVDQMLEGVDLAPLKHFLTTNPAYGQYHESVLDDEAQAYLSQSSSELAEHGFAIQPYLPTIQALQKIYAAYNPAAGRG